MAETTVVAGVVNSAQGSANQPPGATVPIRVGPQGELIAQLAHGRLAESAYRGKLFYGSNGATPSVTTVALATTYTGLALMNPAGSGKNLILEKLGYSFLVAFPAASTIGLMVGYAATGIVTKANAASPGASTLVGPTTVTPAGICVLSATFPVAPTLAMVLGAGLTGAITTAPSNETIADIDGAIILAPGAWVAVYTSTVSGAASLAASFVWTEEPIG